MKLCAQQMLALIPGVQAVEWTYSIESDGAEAEQATVSLDVDGAKEGLSHDIQFLRQICKGGAQTFA